MARWFNKAEDKRAEHGRRRPANAGSTENDVWRMEQLAAQADTAVLVALRAYAAGKGLPDVTAQRTSSSSWAVGELQVEATPRGLEVSSRAAGRHPDQDTLAALLSSATGCMTRSSAGVAFYDSADFTRFAPKGGRVSSTYIDGTKT